jgi:hypothetical protein
MLLVSLMWLVGMTSLTFDECKKLFSRHVVKLAAFAGDTLSDKRPFLLFFHVFDFNLLGYLQHLDLINVLVLAFVGFLQLGIHCCGDLVRGTVHTPKCELSFNEPIFCQSCIWNLTLFTTVTHKLHSHCQRNSGLVHLGDSISTEHRIGEPFKIVYTNHSTKCLREAGDFVMSNVALGLAFFCWMEPHVLLELVLPLGDFLWHSSLGKELDSIRMTVFLVKTEDLDWTNDLGFSDSSMV